MVGGRSGGGGGGGGHQALSNFTSLLSGAFPVVVLMDFPY